MVSVVIPAFNASRFIAETMESVITQSYRELEVIVVDDGSTDETGAIVRAFAERDPRIRYVYQGNCGVAAARNHGIRLSRGEFIAPIDADDIWYPDKIAAQIRLFLGADPLLVLVYTWSAIIDENTVLTGAVIKSTNEGNVFEDILLGNLIGNGSVPLIRRECLDKVGFYEEEFFKRNAQGCEDGDLYLRIAEKYSFAVVKRILVGYRDRSGGMSKQHRCMRRSNEFRNVRLKERQPEIPRKIYRSIDAFFLIYLDRMAQKNGDFSASLRYLFASAMREPAFICFHEYHSSVINRFTSLVFNSLPRFISDSLRRTKHNGRIRRNYDLAELQERAEASLMDCDTPFTRLKKDRVRFVRQYLSGCDKKVANTCSRSGVGQS